MGTLYIVGTPIGNLEDISPRALDVLRTVSLIASENPSRTQRLLARYDIDTPMMRYTDAYDRKKEQRQQVVLSALERGDVAQVSEAGMPGLADPGYELLNAALERDIPVVPVPGPSALAAALSVSGLDGEGHVFVGFVPRAHRARRELFESLVDYSLAVIAYETPHRLLDTLADIDQLFGDRPLVLACELTKLYEEIQRGSAAEILSAYRDRRPRGEYTLILAPPADPDTLTGPEAQS